MDLHLQTLTELATGLTNREFTSVDLTEALLNRIAALDDKLNAFVTVTEGHKGSPHAKTTS